MTLIKWHEGFRTGIRSVDYEHENLVWIINNLVGRLAAGCPTRDIDAALGEIHTLIEAHFALEEKVMRDLRYQGYRSHKDDHDRLLEEIRDIMDDVAGDARFDFRQVLGERVNIWFTRHFATFDKDFHLATRHDR